MANETSKHRDILKMRRRHYRQSALEGGALECGHDHAQGEHGEGEHAHAPKHAGQRNAPAAKLAEVESNLEKLKDQALRERAEFENTRRRLQRDQQQQAEFANQKIIEGLLPVLDNFDRAINNPGESVQTLLSGIQMVRKQLFDYLAQQGLEKIESLGQPFDPNRHEAVSMAPPTEGQTIDQVIEVFQDGYQLKNRLVRPAMVKVAK